MSKKITWKEVYKDFRSRHPQARKDVVYWHPHDYATIMLYFADGTKGTYNYIDRKVKRLDEKWTHDDKSTK